MDNQKILDFLKVKFLIGENRWQYWRAVVVSVVVILIFIHSSNLVDEKVFKIKQLNNRVKELKSEYVGVRSELQRVRLESTIKQELREYGLEHSIHPPQKIKVIVKE